MKNKKVSLGVFHVLKSVMDSKATALRTQIEVARRAKMEEPTLYDHIGNLQQYIDANRYDAVSAREAEYELADYEQQAAAVRAKIQAGQSAQSQLAFVDKFNVTYRGIINGPRIRERRAESKQIEAEMDLIDDYIFACEINLDRLERDAATYAQSESDLEKYRAEYNDLTQRLNSISRQLYELQNGR